MTVFRAALAGSLAILAIIAPAGLGQTQTTLPDVEDEVMCPVCGTTLELASDSPQAIDERELIRDLIAEGLSKEAIKNELVSEFGPEVLATPSTEGFDLAAWIVPGLAVIVGAGAAFAGVRRWRSGSLGTGRAQGTDDASGESDSDRRRLDADLERYDL